MRADQTGLGNTDRRHVGKDAEMRSKAEAAGRGLEWQDILDR